MPDKEVPVDPDLAISGLNNPTCLFIVGFSGLTVVRAARALKKQIQQIFIIEPDMANFKQALYRDHCIEIATGQELGLLLGIPEGELHGAIYQAINQAHPKYGPKSGYCLHPEIVVDPFAYPEVDGKVNPRAEALISVIKEATHQCFLAMGCSSDSFARWERMVENGKNLSQCYRIKPQFGRFEDLPAIVLGAGPSLDDFIAAWKTNPLKDKAVIYCCDASLKKLLDHGIRPHFVPRCERKLTQIFSGVKKEDTKDIFYCGYPWAAPEFFDLFQESFMLFRQNGVCRWTGFDPGEVNGGVSSANACLEMAYLMGHKKIVLSGVDLCFLDGRSHVEGTQVEFDPEKSKAKWHDVPSNDGKMVTTIPVWYRCLTEYKISLMKNLPRGAEVINTSLRGAHIFGTKVMPWSEVGPGLASGTAVDVVARIRSRLERHPPGYADKVVEYTKQAVDFLHAFISDYDKLVATVEDYMIVGRGEETKTIRQLKIHLDAKGFYRDVEEVKKSLFTLYKEPARLIDSFKRKHFAHKLFGTTIIDICQNDYFQMENKIAGLRNTVADEYDRLKHYINLTISLLTLFRYYAEKLVELFESGPEGGYDFEKHVALTQAQDGEAAGL